MDQPSDESEMLAASIYELDTSTFPSSQRTAGFLLKDFNDEQIIAWLSLLRSLQPGYQHFSSSQALSSQHIDALSMLKDYPDSLVLGWLRPSRRAERSNSLSTSYGNDPFTTRPSTAPSHLLPQGSFDSIPQSSSSSLGPLTPYSRNTSATSQGNFSLGFSRRPSHSVIASPSSSSANSIHTHWCITCEKPKPIYTCDGWKRHMKEHEIMFPCMPEGPVRFSDTGPECFFCGITLPNQDHLNAHSIQQCLARPRNYTRKANLIKHLEAHGAINGIALAEEWRIAFKKSYFSCGFCVAIFDTINDQLNHIDVDHFRRSEDIFNWDVTKVIKGLLLQPEVDMAWRNVSAEYTHCGISWDPSTSQSLQLRLEQAEEPAQELAVAAFNESIYDWSHHDYDEPGLSMSPPTQFRNKAVELSAPPRQEISTSSTQATDITPQYQGQQMFLDKIGYAEPHLSYMFQPEAPDEYLSGTAVMEYQHNDAGIHPPLFPSYDHDQAMFQSLPLENQAGLVSTLEENAEGIIPTHGNPSETGVWQPLSQPHAASALPLEFAGVPTEQIDTLSNDNGSIDAPETTQSSESGTLSSNHTFKTSARKKSPSLVSQLKKRFSLHKSKELVTEPEIPMDIDLDSIMSFMEEDEQTRFEMRTDRRASQGH